MKLLLLAASLCVGLSFAAKAADMTLASTDGSQWGVMRLGDDGILHIEASNCVVRTNFCHRYRRMDCSESDKEVISRLVWRSSESHGDWQARAVARLHADGKLSFELPAAADSREPNCLHPMVGALSSAEQEASTGLALTSDVHTANVVIPAAGGLFVHNDGPVYVMGKHVDPECNCKDGLAAAEECANHGDHTCALCHEGFYLTSDSKCKKCPLGHECKGDTAIPVPCGSASRYSDVEGLGTCKTCRAGSFTSGGSSDETATRCEKCGPGTACAAGVRTKCEPGTYGDGLDCRDCGAPNEYSSSFGAAKCDVCLPGRRTHGGLTEHTHTGCVLCREGHRCPDGVQELPCAPGHSTEGKPGQSQCKPCGEPLLYATGYGNAKCEQCPATYETRGASAAARTTCRSCPAGSKCVAGDAHLCRPGTFGADGSCHACGDDSKYSVNDGATRCETCGKGATTGSHSSLPRADVGEAATRKRCRACPAGVACDGSSRVDVCPAGTFSPEKSDVCTPCGDGRAEPEAWYSDRHSGACSKCGAGHTTTHIPSLMDYVDVGSPGQRTVCRACPAGHACDGTGGVVGTRATPCPANTFSPGGAARCSPCKAQGHLRVAENAAGASQCNTCAAGNFITPQGECIPCPRGHECDGTLMHMDECQPGTYARKGSARCEACAGDKLFAPAPGLDDCSTCTKGHYTKGGADGRGHTACMPCQKGFECDGGSAPKQFAGECQDGVLEPSEQARVQWDQCSACNVGFGLRNMKCRACDGVSEFSALKNEQDCEPVTQCHKHEDKYQFEAPTAASDRTCKHHRTPCDLDLEWVVQAATNFKQRVCADNHCTCQNGVGSTRRDCPKHGQAHCKKCFEPYFLTKHNECKKWKDCTDDEYVAAEPTDVSDTVCEPKVCTCDGGTAYRGSECRGNKLEHCKTCHGDRWLNPTTLKCEDWTICEDIEGKYTIQQPSNTANSVCGTKQCYCTFGTAALPGVCKYNGAHHCTQCLPQHWEMDGNDECLFKQCTCASGVPAMGAA
eukprot:g7396.t1